MRVSCSAIVPAYNEAQRIAATLESICQAGFADEVIVIDDGSQDDTAQIARKWTNLVYIHEKNRGKGAAIETGCSYARGEVLLFLDADLAETAGMAGVLLEPVIGGRADMAVAVLPQAQKKGGFGLVKGVAALGVKRQSGYFPTAPLSGQRALRREVVQAWDFPAGFGFEVGLTIHAVRQGYRVTEVPVPFRHRETGRDWQGFVHRGKELLHVVRALRQEKKA